MKGSINKLALLIATGNLIGSIIGGLTIFTALFRSIIVFLGIQVIFLLFLNILRWGLSGQRVSHQNQKLNNE